MLVRHQVSQYELLVSSKKWTYLCVKKQTEDNQKTNISESEDLLSLFGTKGTGARFFNISLEVQVLGANAILNVACFHNIFYSWL